MQPTTELTAKQKLEQLKKFARRVTVEEQIEAGMQRFEEMGVEPEDVERMARLVDLEAVDLYLAVSGKKMVVREGRSASATKATVEAGPDLSDRLRRLEDVVARIGRTAAASNQGGEEDVVTHLRRIADHFDPLPPNIVGTGYIAQKLDCTTIWVTEMIRLGQLPRSCVVPGTGNGKPWKFYRARIDQWITAR